jgi:hypothetical protein
MAPAAEQPHHHKARRGHRGGDVVVNDRRVSQGRQIQAPQALAQETWLAVQEPIDRYQIGVSTAEEQDGSGRLLHKRPRIGVA